jgi:general L-amino acid transport system substrate-binding protein
MLKHIATAAALAAALFTGSAIADTKSATIDAIKARGNFKCGVYENVPGLATLNDKGEWVGFDVDYCRAMAAAILGDAKKVQFVKLTFAQGMTALRSGEIDMAALAITYTIQRDTELGFDFVGPTLYSGHGFMVHKRTGATKLADLNGATICIVAGTITESLIADYFRPRNMTFKPVAIETSAQIMPMYEDGRCDVVTLEPPFLAMRRARLKNPADHTILAETFAKSHMGPVIREEDHVFSNVARWVHYALITAEELGIDAANVESMKASKNPDVRRFLGLEGNIGSKMGLTDDFTVNIVKAVGNYGDIWENSYGMKSPGKLPRGMNALARDGGLQWAPNWR